MSMQIPTTEVGKFTDASRARIWQKIATTKEQILGIADTFKSRDNKAADEHGCCRDYNSDPGIVVSPRIHVGTITEASGQLIYDPTMEKPAPTKRFRLPFVKRAPEPARRNEKQYTSLDVETTDGDKYKLVRESQRVTYTHVDNNGQTVKWSEDPCGNLYIESCGTLYTPPSQ